MDINKIKIAIDTGDLQRAKNMLDSVEKQANKTDKSVGGLSDSFIGLKGAVAGFSALQVATNFVKTADAMNLVDGRLKLATKSTEEYLSQQQALTSIAKSSYTSINDTVTLFTKLNPALSKVGATTNQVNSIVSIFNKGLQLGGASAQESSSAILQFAQAMGSGVLRGEEFNAIAEASPKLMEYLAKGLGVPQTALRKLAENGELTATKVGNALLKIKTDVEKDFASMPVTVGKALTNLQTDLSLAVRELDKTTGATQMLSDEIVDFSSNINSYTQSILNFYRETKSFINDHNEGLKTTTELVKVGIEAYIGYKVIETVMSRGATAVSGLKTAMVAFNPIVGAVALAGSALFETWIEGKRTADNLGKSVDELANSFSKLDIQKRLSDVNKELAEMDKRMQGYSDEYKLASGIASAYNMKYQEAKKLEGALAEVGKQQYSIKKLFEGIDTDGVLKNQKKDTKDLSSELQKIISPISQIRNHYKKLRDELTESGNATPLNLANLAKAEAEAIEGVNKKSLKYSEDLKKKQEEVSKAYTDLAKKGMTEYEQKLYDINLEYIDFVKKTGDMKTGLEVLAQAEAKLNKEREADATKKRNEDLDKQLSTLRDTYDLKEKQIGLLSDENEKNTALTKLYFERRKEEINLEKQKGEKSEEYYKQVLKYEEDLRDQTLFRFSATGQIIESVSSGMKSTMMDFFDYTSDGFGNLKKLALDLGNMIYKAITQQMIVNPLVNSLSGVATSYFGGVTKSAQGNIFSSPSLSAFSNTVVSKPTAFAFASGGVPNLGIMGEKNGGSPEAIIPLTRTSNGDLGVKAVSNNSNGVVKVEVINQGNQEVQITNTSTRNDVEGTVLSIVINGIQNNKMGLRTMLGR